MGRKIVMHEETAYLVSCVLIALAVAMTAAANLGVSMIVAPAYILSLKINFLSFGQAEYVIQGLLFILFCIIMHKVKITYFFSFFTCVFYGFILDLWRSVIPVLNPALAEAEALSLAAKIFLFTGGMLLTSFSVALSFKTYLYPQVYDFFVKKVSMKIGKPIPKFKTFFDFTCLAAALILSFVFFGEIRGIGVGTVIMTVLNGFLIGLFGKILDRFFVFRPLIKKAAAVFDDR